LQHEIHRNNNWFLQRMRTNFSYLSYIPYWDVRQPSFLFRWNKSVEKTRATKQIKWNLRSWTNNEYVNHYCEIADNNWLINVCWRIWWSWCGNIQKEENNDGKYMFVICTDIYIQLYRLAFLVFHSYNEFLYWLRLDTCVVLQL
jgi:hypothetical protein